MKRSWFGFAALAVAVMVVFAPRPWDRTRPADPGPGGAALVGRVLATSFDAVEPRLKDLRKTLRDLEPALWLGCVVALALASLRRRVYALIDPVSRFRLTAAVSARGCRAPPSV